MPDPGVWDFFWESTLKDVQRSNIKGDPFEVVTNLEFLLWGPTYAFRPLPAIKLIFLVLKVFCLSFFQTKKCELFEK